MWEMTMCVGKDADLIVRRFRTREAWVDFLRQGYPDILKGWYGKGDGWEQYGTGYYWSAVKRLI